MTFGEVEKYIPDWIQHVGSRKQFKYGISYVGCDWNDNVASIKKLQLNFYFYFPNGDRGKFIIVLPQNFFSPEPIRVLDDEAKITGLNLSELDIVKLRFMYTLYWGYRCYSNTRMETCLENTLGVNVTQGGYLDYKAF